MLHTYIYGRKSLFLVQLIKYIRKMKFSWTENDMQTATKIFLEGKDPAICCKIVRSASSLP
jgi:hypothetical protein